MSKLTVRTREVMTMNLIDEQASQVVFDFAATEQFKALPLQVKLAICRLSMSATDQRFMMNVDELLREVE